VNFLSKNLAKLVKSTGEEQELVEEQQNLSKEKTQLCIFFPCNWENFCLRGRH
jgi:hypothetical protein